MLLCHLLATNQDNDTNGRSRKVARSETGLLQKRGSHTAYVQQIDGFGVTESWAFSLRERKNKPKIQKSFSNPQGELP